MIVDVYAERKRQQVMQDTWGHLAPQRGKSYKGIMVYAHGGYGDIVLLDATFENLSSSPWLFEAMQEYIGENCKDEGVYKWEGCFEKLDDGCYCFDGEIKRLDFEDIFPDQALQAKSMKKTEN